MVEKQSVVAKHLKVGDFMTPKVTVVNEDDALPLVFMLFDRTGISGAPVKSKTGEYIGVITKTDLAKLDVLIEYLKTQSKQEGMRDLSVRNVMSTRPLVTLPKDASIKQACELMVEQGVHRIFVTPDAKDKTLIGILTTFDIVKAYLRAVQ